MNKQNSQTGHKRNKFSASEDYRLKQLVKTYGQNNWGLVAKLMDHRTARQCRDRYKYFLSPDVNRNPWSIEEEMKLDLLVQMYGKQWSKLVYYFPKRTDINLKCHYTMLERRKQKMLLLKNGFISKNETSKEEKDESEETINKTEPLLFKLKEDDLCDFFDAFQF